MNCKQGDLAVIVKSAAGNEGVILTCIRPYNGPWKQYEYLPGWEVDRKIRAASGEVSEFVPDRLLRPLRDNPGTDESLLWAPVPSKLKEKA